MILIVRLHSRSLPQWCQLLFIWLECYIDGRCESKLEEKKNINIFVGTINLQQSYVENDTCSKYCIYYKDYYFLADNKISFNWTERGRRVERSDCGIFGAYEGLTIWTSREEQLLVDWLIFASGFAEGMYTNIFYPSEQKTRPSVISTSRQVKRKTQFR